MNRTILTLSLTVIMSMLISASVPGFAKVLTIDARQDQLMKEINDGQKAKLLNKKEADRLRKELAKFVKKKKKLKTKNNNQLTAEDKTDLSADLDSISEDIKKSKSNGK